jgi:hypothetical protein
MRSEEVNGKSNEHHGGPCEDEPMPWAWKAEHGFRDPGWRHEQARFLQNLRVGLAGERLLENLRKAGEEAQPARTILTPGKVVLDLLTVLLRQSGFEIAEQCPIIGMSGQ